MTVDAFTKCYHNDVFDKLHNVVHHVEVEQLHHSAVMQSLRQMMIYNSKS